jgi:hypothetical protein
MTDELFCRTECPSCGKKVQAFPWSCPNARTATTFFVFGHPPKGFPDGVAPCQGSGAVIPRKAVEVNVHNR